MSTTAVPCCCVAALKPHQALRDVAQRRIVLEIQLGQRVHGGRAAIGCRLLEPAQRHRPVPRRATAVELGVGQVQPRICVPALRGAPERVVGGLLPCARAPVPLAQGDQKRRIGVALPGEFVELPRRAAPVFPHGVEDLGFGRGIMHATDSRADGAAPTRIALLHDINSTYVTPTSLPITCRGPEPRTCGAASGLRRPVEATSLYPEAATQERRKSMLFEPVRGEKRQCIPRVLLTSFQLIWTSSPKTDR
jgi:hypothetical protein